MQRRHFLRIAAIALAIALPFVLLRFPAVRGALVDLMTYMRSAGARGVLAFLVVQAAAALALAPIWLMSGIAGYVYGLGKGTLIALPGSALAACATFGVGRLLARGALSRLATSSPRLAAVARVAEHHGLKITVLLRATPMIPQNLLGYALATTPLKLGQFALGTLIGLIPATVMHVYIGSIVEDAIALVSGKGEMPGALTWIVFGGGALLTLTTVTITTRIARRELRRALDEAS